MVPKWLTPYGPASLIAPSVSCTSLLPESSAESNEQGKQPIISGHGWDYSFLGFPIPMHQYKQEVIIKDFFSHGQWWHMPLMPVRGRQRQTEFCESETRLVSRMSYWTAKDTQSKLILKKSNQTNQSSKQINRQNKKISLSNIIYLLSTRRLGCLHL